MGKSKTSKLRTFNIVMGSLHLVQAIAMVCLSVAIDQVSSFKPEVTTTYLAFYPLLNALAATSKGLFALPFGIMVSLFLFVPKTGKKINRFTDMNHERGYKPARFAQKMRYR